MKPRIKIFVSHRIDLDSSIISNPLYVPVRCGAFFDDRQCPRMIGDDTGDHISEKRESFCEFTVQYWAWKNVDADYYGLCHYRRYLSFAEYLETQEPHRFAVEREISLDSLRKYNLLNARKMRREISKYDVITSVEYEVNKLPFYPKPSNEREVWAFHPEYLLSEEDIAVLFDVIREQFPMYYETACELMERDVHRGFNCFIMKKQYFQELCEFEFGVLFEMEKRLNINNYAGNRKRTMGYLGEILYGTYINWLIANAAERNCKIAEKQIILFQETRAELLGNSIGSKSLYNAAKSALKRIARSTFPAYRVSLRLEERLLQQGAQINALRKEVAQQAKKNNELLRQIKIVKRLDQESYQYIAPHYEQRDETRREFWAAYPKAEGTLRTVQNGNRYLLERFSELCRAINVRFWLHGGSLIGALRHKGYVPWDDDIDIAMTRDDFSAVRQYLTDHPTEYEIAEYYYVVLGCRSYRFKAKSGLPFFVDIFVYDYYTCQCEELEEWKKIRLFKIGMKNQMSRIAKIAGIVPQDMRIDEYPELKSEIDHLINSYIERFSTAGGAWLLWGLDNNYENETRYAWHHGRIFRYQDIFPLIKCEFEGMECFIPADYKKYAFAEYGIYYLDMPDNIGTAVHYNSYFKDVDIDSAYRELTEDPSQASGSDMPEMRLE